ncbi:MAG TPA: hypothetical protein VHG08_17045 [Longimicrobium sp.]|nr:hypothetical protein [Longimicrobium sp.]
MSRMLCALAAVVLTVAGHGTAAGSLRAAVEDDRPGVAGLEGVLQQGKGQGGGQGNAQGGGQGRGQGGGQEARESRGRSGGDDARPSRQGGEGRGQGQSARSSGQGSGQGSGRSSAARGSGSAEERGKGRPSDAAARSEGRGNSGNAAARSDDRGSSASSAGGSGRGNSGEARGGSASANRSAAEGERRRDRLSGRDLQARIDALPPEQRRMANSRRASERVAVGAIARGHARGLAADAFDVRSENGRVRVLNRRGDLLLDLDDRRAGELGGWQMRRLGDRTPRANAPAFCRSGEGHPVWGREWCIDKGFGLGSRTGTLWSRGSIGDVIFRRPDDRTRLDRGGLIGVLGDIVFGRLALQAITLGYDQPLVGVWLAEPEGPRILRVNSGPYEVAELYDADRDGRAEILYVVQPVW